MANVGGSPSNRSSILGSTSSAYELDLPPVPLSIQLDNDLESSKQRPSKLRTKPNYVRKTVSALSPVVTTPDLELSVIQEQEPSTDSDDSSSTSDDDRESVEVYANVTSLHNGRRNQEVLQGKEDRLYTQLQTSHLEENVYDNPMTDLSTSGSTQSVRKHTDLMTTTDGNRLGSSPEAGGSPELSNHETSYVLVDNDVFIGGVGATKKDHAKSSWRGGRWRRKTSTPSKRSNRTLKETFRYMRAVGMPNSSHRHAKMFFILLLGLIILLSMALGGILIGSLSWGILGHETDMIGMEVNTLNTSLERCRVGRNWVSIPLRANSTPIGELQLTNSSRHNVPLKNLRRNKTNCTSDIESLSQLLIYVVLRTNPDAGSGLGPFSNSYISVSLWTRRDRDHGCTFRQYMSILNDISAPQLASRSFWIPKRGTDSILFMDAQLMDGDGSEMQPINVTVFLAGYC